MELEHIYESVDANFGEMNAAREKTLASSRRAIQSSGNSIRAIHRGDYKKAEKLIKQANDELLQCDKLLRDKFPMIYYAGFVQNAQKEYVEALATFNLTQGKLLPKPQNLKVGFAQYLNGVGEAVGELRRHILDLIRKGKLDQAEQLLDVMDDIFYLLASFDYPDAITWGLRRTTDIARSIMEKTRGDLTTAIRQRALKEAIWELQEKLEAK